MTPNSHRLARIDPSPYDGPIHRADGTRPYNRYLWPTEHWYANQSISRGIDSRWHISIIALMDGTWATDGCTWEIEQNRADGRRVIFPTRIAAIRASAARIIECARASRHWNGYGGALSGMRLAKFINWARNLVARETAVVAASSSNSSLTP